MTALGTQLDSASGGTPTSPPSQRHLWLMSDGAKVALWYGASGWKYAVKPNGGAWGSASSLSITGNFVVAAKEQAYDKIDILTTGGTNVYLYRGTYSAGAISWGSPDATVNNASWLGGGGGNWDFAPTASGYLIAQAGTTTSPGGLRVGLVPYGGTTVTQLSTTQNVGNAYGTGWTLKVRINNYSDSTAYVAAYNSTRTRLELYPITVATAALGTMETPCAFAVDDFSMTFDGSANVDLVYTSSTSLSAIKRTALNTYGTAVSLGTSSYNNLSTLTSGSDLWVFYTSTANYSNGEVYVVKRLSGTWGTPALLIGGDNSGYTRPTAMQQIASDGADVLYAYSGTQVYEYTVPSGTAPNTPIITFPFAVASANTSPPVPTFKSAYSNIVTADTMSAIEWKVIRVSDSHVMWDSGKVTSTSTTTTYGTGNNTGDSNYVAPQNLSMGVQYSVQVRQWDSVTNTASGWSTAQTFTPQPAPDCEITAIASPSGSTLQTSSPVTLTSLTFDVHFSFSEVGGGGSISTVNIEITDPTSGATLETIGHSLGTTLSGGSSATVTVTSTKMQNGGTYNVAVEAIDTVTGAAWAGTNWSATVSIPPPSPPTGLFADVQNDLGYTRLTWSNPAGTTSILVQRRPAGTSTWATTLYSGSPITALKDFSPLNTAFDYGITAYNSSGGVSSTTIEANITLGLVWNTYGYLLNDGADPLNTWVALGIVDAWDSGTTHQVMTNAPIQFVPAGKTQPKQSYDRSQWYDIRQRKSVIQDTDTGPNGAVAYGSTIRAQMEAWGFNHHSVWYRDPDGHAWYGTLQNVQPQGRYNGVESLIQYDIGGVDAGTTVCVVVG